MQLVQRAAPREFRQFRQDLAVKRSPAHVPFQQHLAQPFHRLHLVRMVREIVASGTSRP